MATQIQIRRDNAVNWTQYNPTLAEGEMGYDSTNQSLKVGDGSTAWNDLGYFPVSLDSLTAGSGLEIDLVPDADLTRSIGSSTLRFADIFGDLDGAVKIYARAGEALTKGDAVYISGLHVPSGLTEVSKANASDVNKMPAFGLAQETVSSGDELHVITFGRFDDKALTGYTEGDALYIDAVTDGAITDSPPTGEGNLVQKIGQVLKGGANGTLRVAGAGRTNATPNLNDGNIFIGNSSNQAVTTSLATEIANNPSGVTDLTATTTTTDTGGVVVTGTAPGAFTVAHQAKPTTALSQSVNITQVGIDSFGHVVSISAAADLPSWRSNFGVPSVTESNEYKLRPTSSSSDVIKMFDDMFGQVQNGLPNGSPFYSIGSSGARFSDAYGEYDGTTGVAKMTCVSSQGRIAVFGPQVLAGAAADGSEWVFESRVYINMTSDINNVGRFSIGAFCPTTAINSQSTSPSNVYGNIAKAGISMKADDTYWQQYYYNNEGTNGSTVSQDMTSYTVGSGWRRVAVHCKKGGPVPNIPTWTIKSYIDGTLVATNYITSFTLAPTFYMGIMNNGYNTQNSMDVDWLSFQYTRPTSVTSLQLEDLT